MHREIYQNSFVHVVDRPTTHGAAAMLAGLSGVTAAAAGGVIAPVSGLRSAPCMLRRSSLALARALPLRTTGSISRLARGQVSCEGLPGGVFSRLARRDAYERTTTGEDTGNEDAAASTKVAAEGVDVNVWLFCTPPSCSPQSRSLAAGLATMGRGTATARGEAAVTAGALLGGPGDSEGR